MLEQCQQPVWDPLKPDLPSWSGLVWEQTVAEAHSCHLGGAVVVATLSALLPTLFTVRCMVSLFRFAAQHARVYVYTSAFIPLTNARVARSPKVARYEWTKASGTKISEVDFFTETCSGWQKGPPEIWPPLFGGFPNRACFPCTLGRLLTIAL